MSAQTSERRTPDRKAHHILIVGGGYVGMYTGLRLQRRLRKELNRGDVRLTVVDPQSYMTYQPFLPEAAAGNLEPRHVVAPLRRVLRRATIVNGRYRHAYAGSVAGLGLHKGVAYVYGVKMRGLLAWFLHRTYHLSRVPTLNRKVRVVADWTLALFFRREVVSLGELHRPREEFAQASGPRPDATPFPAMNGAARAEPGARRGGADRTS